MTEAAPACTRVVKALCIYDSMPRRACQAVVSDFPVHFLPPCFPVLSRAFPCFPVKTPCRSAGSIRP